MSRCAAISPRHSVPSRVIPSRADPQCRLGRGLAGWLAGVAIALGLLVAGPGAVGLGTGAALAQCTNIAGSGAVCLRERIRQRRAERRARARALRQQRNEANRRRAAATAPAAARIDPEIQEALNATGFLVGPADGIAGSQTRRGINAFQRALNDPATGTLDARQRDILMRAHATVLEEEIVVTPAQRGALIARVAGIGAAATATAEPIDANAVAPPDTVAAADAPMSADPPSVTAGATATVPEPPAATVPRDEANVVYLNPADQAPDAPAPGGPTGVALCANAASDADVAKVAMLDPNAAILAGFCRPHRYLIDILDPATLGTDDGRADLTTCAKWAAATGLDARAIAALGPPDVDTAFAARVPQGDAPRQSTLAIAKTCLGLAYRHGDMDTGRFYALFAVALGADGFGELAAAHHGLGGEPGADLEAAATWYDWTAQALAGGAATITDDPGQSRVRLLRVLAAKTDSLIDDAATPSTTAPSAALPPAIMAQTREAAAELARLAALLDLDEADIAELCQGTTEDVVVLRVCRLEAYAAKDRDRMRAIDETLADLGDSVGQRALPLWQDAADPAPLATMQ